MATPYSDFTANVGVTINARAQKALDHSTLEDRLVMLKNIALAFGTGINKADLDWHDTRTLAASASEDLDMGAGLTGPFGDTIIFTAIKAIYIYNASALAEIQIGGAAASTFVGPFADISDIIVLPALSLLLLTNPSAAGWAVTDETADVLKVENNDGVNAATYDIFLAGLSG